MKGVFVMSEIVKREYDVPGNCIYCEYKDGSWQRWEYNDDGYGDCTYYENSDGEWEKHEYDEDGNETYYENSTGFWEKYEYDANGNEIYREWSDGSWWKAEYDDRGNKTYYEDSDGIKRGIPRAELENATHNTKYILNGEEYTADELRIGYRITTGLNNDAELTDDEIYSYMFEQFELDERDIEMGE